MNGKARRYVFLTHTSALAGAELLMQRLLDGVGDRPVRVLLLEEGELAAAFRSQRTPVSVLEGGASLGSFRRDSGLLGAFAQSAKVARLAARVAAALEPGDVVVAGSQKAFMIAALARLRAKFRLVWWLHDVLGPEHFSPFAIRMAVTVSNLRCDGLIATSPEALAAYRVHGGRVAPAMVVEPGVDLSKVVPRTDDHTRPIVVLLASRISPWKGQMVAIEALGRMARDGKAPECWIAGGALFGEDDYLAALEARVRDLGLEGRVRFLGHRKDVPALLSQADIFVHVPTAPEPFGQVVVEAMASGVPVVASEIGAIGRILDPGAGILVPPDDPPRLAEALDRLLGSPKLRAQMGARGPEAARTYDIGGVRGRFFDALAAV